MENLLEQKLQTLKKNWENFSSTIPKNSKIVLITSGGTSIKLEKVE